MKTADLTELAEGIVCIGHTEEPLSADVVILEGREYFWIFDVGAHPDIPEILNRLPKPRKLILSHFHGDHIGNLRAVDSEEVFVGRQTRRHTGCGRIVEEPLEITDGGLRLKILPLPSGHAKGSLALEADGTHLFLGDGVYAAEKEGQLRYNAGLLQEQIALLEKTEAPWFYLSHKTPFRYSRRVVLKLLRGIYAERKEREVYIPVKGI